jgi:hypothetical protein
MRRYWIAVFIFAALACGRKQESAEDNAELSVAFFCQLLEESDDEGRRYALHAEVGAYKTKIAELKACEPIPPERYGDYAIPPEALAAAGGWWAGAGDYFYARRDEAQIQFFQGYIDEASDSLDFDYRLLAAYRDGRFYFERE